MTHVALMLPLAELLVAGGLLLGNQAAAFGAIAPLLVFAAAMAINIRFGRRHIDCGGGHAGLCQTLGWPLVARNMLMVLGLAPRPAPGVLDLTDASVGTLAGVAAFVLMQMFKIIIALPRRGGAKGLRQV